MTAEPVVVEGLELLWYVELAFADVGWWRDAALVRIVVDALAATARWQELEVIGAGYKAGAPLGSPAEVARQIGVGGPGLYNLARGGPAAAIFADETDAWLQLGIAERVVTMMSHVRGEVLERLGPAAIDDLVQAISTIRATLGPRVHVVEMHARPTAVGELRYPRPLPHRRAAVPLAAVVDVVDLAPVEGGRLDARGAVARAIATAEVPPGVTRTVLGELLVVRWIDDPRSPSRICAAAARHEAWLANLVPTTLETV